MPKKIFEQEIELGGDPNIHLRIPAEFASQKVKVTVEPLSVPEKPQNGTESETFPNYRSLQQIYPGSWSPPANAFEPLDGDDLKEWGID